MPSSGKNQSGCSAKVLIEIIGVIASAITIFSFASGIVKLSDLVNIFAPVKSSAPEALATPAIPPTSTDDHLYNSPTKTPYVQNDGTDWFFSPHPAEPLYAFRRSVASMAQYQNGMIVWLQDRGQSFVLFQGGRWQNFGGDIQSTYPAVSSQLGVETRGQRNWVVCEGNTTSNDLVTAYISDPDNRILSWSIQGYNPVRWQYIDSVSFNGCG